MTINWGALGSVAAVSLAVGVAVVALVSLALVGLSARAAAEEAPGRLSPGAGTAVAVLCLAAASAVVLYGFSLLIF